MCLERGAGLQQRLEPVQLGLHGRQPGSHVCADAIDAILAHLQINSMWSKPGGTLSHCQRPGCRECEAMQRISRTGQRSRVMARLTGASPPPEVSHMHPRSGLSSLQVGGNRAQVGERLV